ncbi:MAG: DUF4838 domain-containing protein [Verrucomicrobiales bacterium]|nr:DUF4838 domain-containing protein [Verrucomicrobiales bacterium]
MRYLFYLIVFGLLPGSELWGESKDHVIESRKVEPESYYRLTFEVQSDADQAKWILRMVNGAGEYPFAGSYDNDWQQIVPGKTEYSQAFRTAGDAENVELLVRTNGGPPQVSKVHLEEVVVSEGVLNGDFSEGAGNYSGWSEQLNTQFIEIEGRTALKINHNGYALTDPIPVESGGVYQLTRGSTSPSYLLFYDKDRYLLGSSRYSRPHKLEMPGEAAFLRLLFQTSFDHIPIYRTKTIEKVGLSLVDKVTLSREITSRVSYPGEIVLNTSCDPREEFAARELQHWIGEITGKRIPLLAEPSNADHPKFYIGSQWTENYTDDLQFLADSDGYAVRRDGKDIYLFGSHPRGTLFGVYGFLEKNTDIIWPRPHPDFDAIFSKVKEIEFTQADFRTRPTFDIREVNFSGSDPNPAVSQRWLGRNGSNTPLKLGKGFPYLRWLSGATIGVGGGYIWSFIGLEEEDETLYPEINGKRLRNRWRQPCYTHPEVPKLISKAAREMLASVPGRDIEFLISRVGDNWEVCSCSECMKPIKLEDGSELVAKAATSNKDPLFFSTRNYLMLNKVAEEMTKDYPDFKLHTHAYIFAAEPPRIKLHPAIVPHFAAYPTKDERYPILEQPGKSGAVWGKRFQQWDKEQDVNFGFFGYYYGECYNAFADTAGPDYKALASIGGIHAHCEGYPGDSEELSRWDFEGSEKWIIAKLQWDPTLDPAALREQYINRTFRDAAEPMRKFYQLINDSWHDAKNPNSVNCHTASKKIFTDFIVEPGLENRARTALVEALDMASDPKSRKIIERMLAQFDRFADELNRLPVPLVPESTEQWSQYDSPHWYKAHQVGDFKLVPQWEPLSEDADVKHETTVAMMRDKNHLYFRIDAFTDQKLVENSPASSRLFPKGDRVEIILRSGRDTFYFALGADGGTYLLKNWDTANRWSSQSKAHFLTDEGRWSVLFAVPFDEINVKPGDADIDGKFCRVVNPDSPDREESSYNGRGIFNNHTLLRSPLKLGE